jgi:tetratricopeptide (TPR) repeat protein
MMRSQLFCAVLLLLTSPAAKAQEDPGKYYQRGLEKIKAEDLDSAVILFGKAAELEPDNYYAVYNRGIAYSMMDEYEQALADFNRVVYIAPAYKKGWLNRGIARRHLTDYDGAVLDYTKAIQLDPAYSDAYYNRGIIYELLEQKDKACADFSKAQELGLERATSRLKSCSDTGKSIGLFHPILRLTKTANSARYGFTEKDPVKVASGPDGGPGNQRAYLNLLRDPQGKRPRYKRLGSCCFYKSAHALIGSMAMLDKYEISYRDEKGKAQTSVIYISMYDYEEPKVLKGFHTVQKP